MNRLFSYGTLRQHEVQMSLFGRAVPTIDDALPGFRIDTVKITDSAVIARSGTDIHPILRRGTVGEVVPEAFLELPETELHAADDYEVDDYKRVPVVLRSGLDAWVYIAGTDT